MLFDVQHGVVGMLDSIWYVVEDEGRKGWERGGKKRYATTPATNLSSHTISFVFGFNNVSFKTRYSSLKAATSCLSAL